MSLAARLVLLIGFALLPTLAIQGWAALEQSHALEARLQVEAVAQTRAAQAAMSRVVEGVHQLLTALAEMPVIRAGNLPGCTAYLRAVAGRFRNYTLLGVNDAQGVIQCTSAGATQGEYSNAGRAYHQRAMASGGFAAGDLVTGIATRRRSIHFALPFRRMDGTGGGIVLASLDQDWLAGQLAALALPPGAQAMILDPSGNVVVAVQDGAPLPDDQLGRPVPEGVRNALEVRVPAAHDVYGIDGTPRLLGAMPADPDLAGIVVAVALDRGRAFDDIDAATQRTFAGLFLGAALALAAGLVSARRFVLDPLERLSAAAERVGRGEFGARADLGRHAGAIGAVGTAFDRMSAALGSREEERDRAQAAQRIGEARLRLLLDSMGEGFYTIDPDGTTTLCNASFLRMMGFAREQDAIGRKLHDVIHHSHPDGSHYASADCPIYRAARDGEPVHVTGERFWRLDGTSFPVEYWVQPIQRDGKAQGAVCTFIDVTERERAAAALLDSKERLRLAQRAGGIGTFELDSATRTLTVSEEFCRLWGIAPVEMVRLDMLLEMIVPDDRPQVADAHRDIRADALSYVEYRVARADTGEVRWIARQGEPRVGPSGDGAAGDKSTFVGVVYDVTARKQMEDELRQLNGALEQRVQERTAELMAAEATLRQSQKMEAVGQLTGGIAHDFNNMLQAIGGSLEMMRRRVSQGRPEEGVRFVESALKTVDRAAALTHRLLAFARRQALQPREVDANALVSGMDELIRRTVGLAVVVELQLAGDVSGVVCDPNQLENVLLNLAINARDAMEGGGTLVIRTGNVREVPDEVPDPGTLQAADFVEISVADTGSGMDETTRARAFEPFYTTKPIGQGTGLGLSQVYGFVRQSDGFVRLESTPGVGTVVRLFLPQHAASPAPAGTPAEGTAADDAGPRASAATDPKAPGHAPGHAPGQGPGPGHRLGGGRLGSVLLVEDEPDVRTMAADHLRELGYAVQVAGDGATALEALQGDAALSVLVTDVGLPGGLNGRQVADAARERRPGLPVLFITGYAGTALAEGLEPGMEVIGKPFSLETLSVRIAAMLRGVGGT